MSRCTFKQGKFNCGSYAFNLYKNDIDQGDLCDVHYWQDQAQKARADEREQIAQMFDGAPPLVEFAQNEHGGCLMCGFTPRLAVAAIRARGASMSKEAMISGALFDFMGWLTSRPKRIMLSSADDASPAVDAIKDFAKMRGLSLDDARVQDWQDNIKGNT